MPARLVPQSWAARADPAAATPSTLAGAPPVRRRRASAPTTRPAGARPTNGGGGGGNLGGLLNGSTPSAELVSVLDANASDYTWVAAAIGSNQASGYQLNTVVAALART